MKKVIFLVSVVEVDSDDVDGSTSNTATKANALQLLEALGNGDLSPDGTGDCCWDGILRHALDRVEHGDALRLMMDEQGDGRLQVQDDLSLKDLDAAKRENLNSPAGKLATEIETFIEHHKTLDDLDSVKDLVAAAGGKKRKEFRTRIRDTAAKLAAMGQPVGKFGDVAIVDFVETVRTMKADGKVLDPPEDE